MVLSKTIKTWIEAKKFCRDHYTDLAFIKSQADQDEITSLIFSPAIWIGLYRDTWKWSDQSNVTSSTQDATKKFNFFNKDCAGAYNYYRVFDDIYCTWAYYFYCNTGKSGLSYFVHSSTLLFVDKLNMNNNLYI